MEITGPMKALEAAARRVVYDELGHEKVSGFTSEWRSAGLYVHFDLPFHFTGILSAKEFAARDYDGMLVTLRCTLRPIVRWQKIGRCIYAELREKIPELQQ